MRRTGFMLLALLGMACSTAINVRAETPSAKFGGDWSLVYRCFVAPYNCKPIPCSPSYCYDSKCDDYCKKPMPCPPKFCFPCGVENYCPKPPVCRFPLSPCPECDCR